LHKAVVYPKVAKENDVDCIVVVEFLVSENGLIEEVKTIQDPGDGLGQAVIDAVYSMNKMKNKWKPATINGVPRKGKFKLPIKCSTKFKAKKQ
jgi:periplasmic protein TonB